MAGDSPSLMGICKIPMDLILSIIIRRLTVRMIAEKLSINKDTVWSVITENLEMRKDGPQAVVRGPETAKSHFEVTRCPLC